MEQLVYKNYLVGVPGVPALPLTLAYGEDQGFRFLVIQVRVFGVMIMVLMCVRACVQASSTVVVWRVCVPVYRHTYSPPPPHTPIPPPP